MKAILPFIIVIIFCHTAFSHLFYHDIMSEDDVTYGLPTVRVRRETFGNAGRVGPLYTHVKTDEGGTFKWGTKHMVGAMFAGNKDSEEDKDDSFGF